MQEQEIVPSNNPKRRSHRTAFVLVSVVALALLWIGYWWLHGRFYQSTDDAYVGGNVTVISPRVSGYVAEISVKDNAYVHAGDPLVELDPADFDAKRRAALARVQVAQAAIVRLNSEMDFTHAEIAQAKAEQRVSGAALVFAEQDAARYGRLAVTKAGTLQAAQEARSRQDQADAKYQGATEALKARQYQLSVVEAQGKEAHAALLEAQAELHEASLNASYTVIRAPVDGYVGNRAANVGTFVGAGTQLIALVPSQGLWVDANFKEDQIGDMHPGQAVDVVADVDSGSKITGHVVSMSPASGAVFSLIPAQNATGNFTKIVQRVTVRIALDGKFASVGALRPGLSVTATVDTRKRER